jgi:hypothetical protein
LTFFFALMPDLVAELAARVRGREGAPADALLEVLRALAAVARFCSDLAEGSSCSAVFSEDSPLSLTSPFTFDATVPNAEPTVRATFVSVSSCASFLDSMLPPYV